MNHFVILWDQEVIPSFDSWKDGGGRADLPLWVAGRQTWACPGAWLRLPWELILEGRGVQEGCTSFRKEILKVQEQLVPMSQEMSRQEENQPGWTESFDWNSGEKESFWPLEEGAQEERRML